MTDSKPIRHIAIIGTGVIGASWSALFLAKGLEVTATDVAPNAEAALRRFVDAAWPASEDRQHQHSMRGGGVTPCILPRLQTFRATCVR
jgi:3-hydroxyacyl-CoA dehydrogenase